MSDLERYLISKLNSQHGVRYRQLLDELRAIKEARETIPVAALNDGLGAQREHWPRTVSRRPAAPQRRIPGESLAETSAPQQL